MNARPIQVLLVDDHPLVRDGVRMRLQATEHIGVAGEASSLEEATQLAASLRPDIVLTDVRMPDGSGIQLAKLFGQQFPELRVVVFSMHGDQEYVRRAVDMGVWGYVLKTSPAQEVVQALTDVHAGIRFFSPSLQPLLLADDPPARPARELTQREAAVLALLAEGHSNKEIALRLGASIRTVETHRLHLRRKLHIGGRAALVKYAVDYAELDQPTLPGEL